MNRTVDTRILAFGLLLGLALLVRPIDTANASWEITGSIPTARVQAGSH
ncbi:MAG: hypothetical protein OEL76_17420 [Siculibacillus sp.]|nr:hypothetical protein [Siculibacillus sp.]